MADKAIDITGDGGVLKEIKKPGVGEATPGSGCKVKVHYTGTLLDGTVFDSSKTRGEPFEFDLGKGQVIKAWDKGIATMKKEETAVFTCQSQYAYGKQGSPPTIPPDATLVFEVDMLDWAAEDISPEKDGGITRELLIEGQSFSSPNEGSNVEISLKGEYNGKVFQEGNFEFCLGEGSEQNLPEGLEKALESFKIKEKSILVIKAPYAFGSKGNDKLGIPPNADLQYTVTLNNFQKLKGTWELNADEKLEQGKKLKEKGTHFFKQEKYVLALKNYKRAIEFLALDAGFEEPAEQERKNVHLASQLNAALCLLKLGQNVEARAQCNDVLEVDSKNEKALFRRALALIELGEPELASSDFQSVLSIDPNNKAAAQKLALCKQRIKEQRAKEKQTYANMFDRFAKHDTEVSSK